MNEVEDMKICDLSEYNLTYRALAPDRVTHQVIFNKLKYKNGYIHNKRYKEDDSYYAPYLAYKIGEKVGVELPETELGLILHINADRLTYMDSYYESSIVYDKNLEEGVFPNFGNGHAYVASEVVMDSYLTENSEIEDKRGKEMRDTVSRQTVDDYINSYIYYLTTRGNKPKEQYSKTEIDFMKQKLIDRLLFGLKFGINGNFDIMLNDYKNAELSSYYMSSHDAFGFNVKDEWLSTQLEKSDEEFKKVIDKEYRPQYGLMPNTYIQRAEDVVRYVFEQYPNQSEKSYKKLSKFTREDLEKELNSYNRMRSTHKKFALRIFDIRNKEFNQIYQEHMRNQAR